ncbi:MAG: flagellar hook-length control protein FliK, partial [Planctomycetes bacterium]|nr:flagellar hook-length control protein FliK [Planctomycetota bacterium]
LVAPAAGEEPAPAPAWQQLAEPGEQRPVASQPLIADAPPPSGIPAAALQMQAVPAAEARRSPPLAARSESTGHEALRATPPAPLEARPVTAATPVLRASPPTPVERAIAGQITRQLVHTEANGDRTLVIRLTPAELGTVRIELREHNGTLTAHLRVEDEAVGRAIDRMLPSMRQDLRGQDSPLADVVREPRDQRQGDQRGNGQPQDQSTPWSRQQERDSNRQGRRQSQAQVQAAFSLAGLVDEGAPLVPGEPAAGLARPLR